MTDVLKRAKAHFSSLNRQSMEVPEWGEGDQPLTIYWQPWTLFQKDQLYQSEERLGLALVARAIVMKAEDDDGRKLFSDGDEKVLMREASASVLSRIAAQLGPDVALSSEAVSEAVKN